LKSTGIVRKVDDLGRIVIPIELRRSLNIGQKDSVEIFVDGDLIVLRKYQAACIFCGNADNLIHFKGYNVCAECLQRMASLRAELSGSAEAEAAATDNEADIDPEHSQ